MKGQTRGVGDRNRSGMPKKSSAGGSCARRKMHKVMGEYKRGTLKSGGRTPAKSRAQAIAIGLSEARGHCGSGSVKRRSKHRRRSTFMEDFKAR